MSKENELNFDVAVIGGGPAGMMAAIKASELDARVLLLEKNETLGRKLLVTGQGRSNLTRAEFDVKMLAKRYGREGGFLLSALTAFGPKETINFFEKRGLKTKIERGKRIFPESDRAKDVLALLIRSLSKNNVEVKSNARVQQFFIQKNRIAKIILPDNTKITASNYIVATGGLSFPGTGSTGDGYLWLEKLGHKIEKLRPALVPMRIKEKWPQSAQGLSLKNVELTVLQDNKKQDSRFGEMLFTHFGVSGPIVLDLSFKVGELLDKGEVKLNLDLKPALTFEVLDRRIQNDFSKYRGKLFKNSLDDLLPQKMIPIIIQLSGIGPDKKVNEISRAERHQLVKLFKGLEMQVSGLLGFENAIITAGGVSLKEIDAKTMKSKLIENLFLAGEILNIHGPTGGYNLQQSWSTGYLAGQSAAIRCRKF